MATQLEQDPAFGPGASPAVTQAWVREVVARAMAGATPQIPVGYIVSNDTGVNPGTELGYGTWVAFAPGRVLVGYAEGDPDFGTAGATPGAKTVAGAGTVAAPTLSGATANESSHTHDYSQVAGHAHAIDISSNALETAGTASVQGSAAAANASFNTDASGDPGAAQTGAGSAHSHGVGTLAASAPAFTGSATSVVQPSIVIYHWKRTA